MKVAIVGSRHFTDYNRIVSTFDFFFKPSGDFEIVSGGCKGVDELAERLAKERGLKLVVFPPKDGATFGQKCVNRNKQIVEYSDAVLAFWDGRTEHCGTLITMHMAVKAGKNMYAIGV